MVMVGGVYALPLLLYKSIYPPGLELRRPLHPLPMQQKMVASLESKGSVVLTNQSNKTDFKIIFSDNCLQ